MHLEFVSVPTVDDKRFSVKKKKREIKLETWANCTTMCNEAESWCFFGNYKALNLVTC